ncbi:MAG: sialidase family protein, partial [Kiritimatiellae bacterium]|nr:sialidase family protein [Kiritimatiellia bacterium]
KLKDSANLDHFISAGCSAVVVGSEQVIPASSVPQTPRRIGLALRKAGNDSCAAYRIPGLEVTPKGTLIAVYDARWKHGGDLPGDIDVGMSRSTDGGRTWSPMKIIMDMGKDPQWSYDGIGDPCVVVDQKTGVIWVAALWSHGKRGWSGSGPGMTPEETGQFVLVKSEDDGVTWSGPINITEQIKDPEWPLVLASPGRGITMRDGTLVIPSQYQDTLENKRMPYSTIVYSRDHGQSWKMGSGARSNTTECRVVELGDGSLMLNMRDNRGGSRAVCVTADLGTSWTEHSSSRKALPEPVCNAGLIRVEGKDNVTGKNMLIFLNPATTKGRYNMTLKVSLDEGVTWPAEHHLLLDGGRSAGYPSMAMIDSETLGVLYEGSRAHLTFQRIKIRDLFSPLRGEK